MSRIRLQSSSRAEDASYRALADAAQAATSLLSWRIVGGHMVNLHAARVGVQLPSRATRDADLAVELIALREGDLLQNLRDLGYDNPHSSNRFERETSGQSATIDVLAPSYTTGHIPNMDAGQMAVDGIPALHVALSRPATTLDLDVRLSTGTSIATQVMLPDLPSAIAVKIFSYHGRFAPRDAEDLRRLLEAAWITRVEWPSSGTFSQAGALIIQYSDSPGRGLADAVSDSPGRTRLRALTRSLLRQVPMPGG